MKKTWWTRLGGGVLFELCEYRIGFHFGLSDYDRFYGLTLYYGRWSQRRCWSRPVAEWR